MKKYICENCKKEVSMSDSFCGSCGSNLQPINDVFIKNLMETPKVGDYYLNSKKKIGLIKRIEDEVFYIEYDGEEVYQPRLREKLREAGEYKEKILWTE